MDFEEAWQRVGLAGRELGAGPARAVPRVFPGADDARDWLTARKVPDLNAGAIALGIAVGLVMAEQPEALAELDEIEREWRRDP